MGRITLLTKPGSGSTELNRVLENMNNEGEFSLSILTDLQGLTIASATDDGTDSEQQSALVAIIQRTIGQVSERMGMAQMDEISFHDATGQRIVSRNFHTNAQELILSVRMSGKQKSYRRLTNLAINKICNIWSHYWERSDGIER